MAIANMCLTAALWRQRSAWLRAQQDSAESVYLLRNAATRYARLHDLAATMLAAQGPDTLLMSVLAQINQIAGADGALAVTRDTDDAEKLRIIPLTNDDKRFPKTWSIYDTDNPAVASVQSGHACWLETREALELQFPHFSEHIPVFADAQAVVALPFTTPSYTYGCILLTFSQPQRFLPIERTFFLAVATQCTIALERFRLTQSELAAEARHAALTSDVQQALAVREQFLTVLAHELRTPLASLQLRLGMLNRFVRKPSMTDEKRVEALKKITQDATRLANVIDSLLDVSRVASGKLHLQFEPVNLDEVVAEVAQMFAEPLENAGCELRIQYNGTAARGYWDRQRIEQVVTNLLNNAIKYGSHRPIEVNVETQPRQVILKVRDHGMGIAAADRARIFGKFERAVSERHFGGMGVGLWVSREIVQAHGGTIIFDTAEGQGTTFTVALPRREGNTYATD